MSPDNKFRHTDFCLFKAFWALLLFLVISIPIKAQLATIQKSADRAFNNFAFKEALDKYFYLHEKDTGNTYYLSQLARSYLKLNDSKNAEIWLRRLVNQFDSVENNLLYEYAQVLSKNKKYNEAELWFTQYKNKGGSRSVNDKLLGVSNPDQFLQNESKYSITKLGLNTNESDFSPFFYDDGVAFVSSRSNKEWVKENYNWDESDYLDFYYFSIGDTLTINKINGLNSKYHEGPAHIYAAGTKAVFTRNNILGSRLKRDQEGVVNLQIFFALRDSLNNWGTITPFEYNSSDYSLGHPTISSDGNLLIFASNMPDGLGGTDLYFSRTGPDGKWSRPRNMGSIVNTSENELFPYQNGNQLFFASNGHEGLGGLDVYRIEIKNGQPMNKPENLGAPINSNQDDFGLITSDNLRSGFFTSDRDGSDDIFEFTADFVFVYGQILSKQDETPISNAEVIFLGKDKTVITSSSTDKNGNYRMEIGKGLHFDIEVKKKDYFLEQPVSESTINCSDSKTFNPIYLVQKILITQAIDEASKEIISDILQTVTDLEGNNTLSPTKSSSRQYSIDNGKRYEIVTASEGYYTQRDTLEFGDEPIGKKEYTASLKKIIVGESIKLDHIYYDVNSAKLRHESELELDKVVVFMMDNPQIKIELGSHTDSRGSASYNLNLSQKRAESASNYLVRQGINEERIIPKGYGETKINNQCVDGIKCSAKQHQSNRRTVIKILGS
ncbi:MAG: OmpA family protein [Cyclobacteriaceae bacterium]